MTARVVYVVTLHGMDGRIALVLPYAFPTTRTANQACYRAMKRSKGRWLFASVTRLRCM